MSFRDENVCKLQCLIFSFLKETLYKLISPKEDDDFYRIKSYKVYYIHLEPVIFLVYMMQQKDKVKQSKHDTVYSGLALCFADRLPYLLCVRKLPLAWPEPSHPGVGHTSPSILGLLHWLDKGRSQEPADVRYNTESDTSKLQDKIHSPTSTASQLQNGFTICKNVKQIKCWQQG